MKESAVRARKIGWYLRGGVMAARVSRGVDRAKGAARRRVGKWRVVTSRGGGGCGGGWGEGDERGCGGKGRGRERGSEKDGGSASERERKRKRARARPQIRRVGSVSGYDASRAFLDTAR